MPTCTPKSATAFSPQTEVAKKNDKPSKIETAKKQGERSCHSNIISLATPSASSKAELADHSTVVQVATFLDVAPCLSHPMGVIARSGRGLHPDPEFHFSIPARPPAGQARAPADQEGPRQKHAQYQAVLDDALRLGGAVLLTVHAPRAMHDGLHATRRAPVILGLRKQMHETRSYDWIYSAGIIMRIGAGPGIG